MKQLIKRAEIFLLAVLMFLSTPVFGEHSSEQDELSIIKNDLSVEIYTTVYESLKESDGNYIQDYSGAYMTGMVI